MKKVAILLGLAMGWAQTGFTAEVAPAGNATAGKAQTAVCAACHGADGNSAVPTFPKLAGQGSLFAPSYRYMADVAGDDDRAEISRFEDDKQPVTEYDQRHQRFSGPS